MSKKLNNQLMLGIIEGLIIVVLGILIAVVGIGQTVDIYFGVLALVMGVSCIILSLFLLKKNGIMPIGITLLAGSLIALGCGLFAKYISFAVIINILVLLVLGAGAGLIAYGIYFTVKRNKFYGIIQIIVGVGLVTLTSIYINVPDFAKAFWVVVGILVAFYGAFNIVYLIVNKNEK